MSDKPKATLEAGPEQLRYSSILEKGMYIGLAALFITFAIYAFGILEPYIPHDDVSKYWAMNVHDYLHQANISPGWAWLKMIGHGDFMNFIGITILAGTTIICYLSIIPILIKSRDFIYAVLAGMEVVILGLAASGLLAVGH
ncbi:MAG: DUF1634 domain-containing protein [Deltaproteobacteria bacterium]|nr:DUF1634 domain-containing protein [Deltaproteobacteria bacterium]MBW2110130.1 DUF1634 domain-containing protein [Deltaproteobacteria bacterium]MBW2352586.1 DUF1634 domain-containing protein [Deltaproteobacteria bacterium]